SEFINNITQRMVNGILEEVSPQNSSEGESVEIESFPKSSIKFGISKETLNFSNLEVAFEEEISFNLDFIPSENFETILQQAGVENPYFNIKLENLTTKAEITEVSYSNSFQIPSNPVNLL